MKCEGILVLLSLLLVVISIKPPKEPPPDLLDQYTLNNSIPLEYFYVDDTEQGNSTHYRFSAESMEVFIRGCERTHGKIVSLQQKMNNMPLQQLYRVMPKENWIFLSTLKFYPYHRLELTKAKGLKAVVFGSTEPWIETWLIYLGITEVVTSEYNDLTYEHDQIVTISGGSKRLVDESIMTRDGSMKSYLGYFDIAVSMSSFDHDGLGRYGDPLNPDGDIIAMNDVLKLLKPKGKFFLSVPIGPDVIVWNLQRRYGLIRLPMLLKGWSIIDRVGWDEMKLDQPASYRQTFEPILVLRPANLISKDEITNTVLNDQVSQEL